MENEVEQVNLDLVATVKVLTASASSSGGSSRNKIESTVARSWIYRPYYVNNYLFKSTTHSSIKRE